MSGPMVYGLMLKSPPGSVQHAEADRRFRNAASARLTQAGHRGDWAWEHEPDGMDTPAKFAASILHARGLPPTAA